MATRQNKKLETPTPEANKMNADTTAGELARAILSNGNTRTILPVLEQLIHAAMRSNDLLQCDEMKNASINGLAADRKAVARAIKLLTKFIP